MFKSRNFSIISAVLMAALPMHMSDADAAAAPVDTELFYNATTKVIFADVSTRAAEDGISEVAIADVAGLVANGATIDASAQPIIDAAAGNGVQAAADPAASATTSAGVTDPNVSSSSASPATSTADVSVGDTATDPNVVASPAVDTPAVASSSAADASPSVVDADPVPVTAASSAAVYEPAPSVVDAPTTGELTAAASVAPTTPAPTLAEVPVDDANAAPVDQNTGKVVIAADDHTEAKDRFAGVLAALHTFEEDSVEKLKEELRAIGTLLHLHSVASSTADSTGDYKASDLS